MRSITSHVPRPADAPLPSAHASSALSGVLLVAFTLLSWASVPLFLRFLNEAHLDPFSQNGWRYGISALFWLPVLVWARRRGQVPRALLVAAIVPALFNIVGQTLFAWGPALLQPGFFSFVFRVQIVFVTLGAYLLFPSERGTLRSPRFWIGIVLVVAGSAGLILFKGASAEGSAPLLGIVISIAAGVMFAGYGLAVRYYVSRYAPVLAFGVICNYTAVMALAVMLALGTRAGARVLDFTLLQLGMLVLSAFIGIAISHVSYYASIRRLGVSLSLGIIQLQPIFTALGSWMLFDERLRTEQWACGVLGLAGAIVMLSAGKAQAQRAAVAEDA